MAANYRFRPPYPAEVYETLLELIREHPRFERRGHRITAPVSFSQSIADYLHCQHSRATWSEDHLGEKASAEFDAAMTAILSRHARDGTLTFNVQTRIEWGRVLEARVQD